jgi:predicted RecB family endonuclease
MEAPRKSGNVDVLAAKDGKTIAIEVETGKSDVVRNVKQDLLSEFDKVLVVATDEKALRKVEQELAQVGLIIPGKVEVGLLPRNWSGLATAMPFFDFFHP